MRFSHLILWRYPFFVHIARVQLLHLAIDLWVRTPVRVTLVLIVWNHTRGGRRGLSRRSTDVRAKTLPLVVRDETSAFPMSKRSIQAIIQRAFSNAAALAPMYKTPVGILGESSAASKATPVFEEHVDCLGGIKIATHVLPDWKDVLAKGYEINRVSENTAFLRKKRI